MIPKISEKYIDVNKIINESNTIFLQSNLKIEEDNNSKNILKEDKLNDEKKDLSQKEIPKEKMKYNNSKDLFLEKKLDDISLSHEINDKSTDSFKEVVLEKSEQILQNKKNEHFNDDLKNIPIKKDNSNNSSNSSSSESSDSDSSLTSNSKNIENIQPNKLTKKGKKNTINSMEKKDDNVIIKKNLFEIKKEIKAKDQEQGFLYERMENIENNNIEKNIELIKKN